MMTLEKHVRLALIGGFLGAGKTTSLVALANEFARRGLCVGIVTNDQAKDLADTEIVRRAVQPVAEVAGGCFCCRFDDLLHAADSLRQHQPDVILCEPVGSCTDVAATVLNPLKRFYPHSYDPAPLSVLVDPQRLREIVLGELSVSFPGEAHYIFEKQLEEADVIVLNKIDCLDVAEGERLIAALQRRYQRPVLPMSALRGQHIGEWAGFILNEVHAGGRWLREIDYDVYARGEAMFGWLNTTVRLRGQPRFDPAGFLDALMGAIVNGCAAARGEIAHVKATLTEGAQLVQAHVTDLGAPVMQPAPSAASTFTEADLIVNARVHIEPDALSALVTSAIQQAAAAKGIAARIVTLQSFSPAYPRPTHRLAEPA
jgi:Ni2+-binding GTPase involved in maturation of urease and hydrogenase